MKTNRLIRNRTIHAKNTNRGKLFRKYDPIIASIILAFVVNTCVEINKRSTNSKNKKTANIEATAPLEDTEKSDEIKVLMTSVKLKNTSRKTLEGSF